MFDIIVFIGGICGLAMVMGSMLLLWKGTIKLQKACAGDAGLSIEILKEIKVTSRNPALGLFLIGLVFFLSSAFFAREGSIEKIELIGEIESGDKISGVEIHLLAGPWKRDVLDSRGRFREIYHPNVNRLCVKVMAPGYENTGIGRTVELKSGSANVGKINIGKRIIKDIHPKRNINKRQETTGELADSSKGSY